MCEFMERVAKLNKADCSDVQANGGECPDTCRYQVLGVDCEYTAVYGCDICGRDWATCPHLDSIGGHDAIQS